MEKRMGELKVGDKVWNTGILFEVVKIEIHDGKGYGCAERVVRYVGKIVGGDTSLKGTGYDGGTYGGIESLPVHVSP